ncbi:MAG: methylated-DNA--[protein]-cysteine S-methyltransferase [Magnetococcales bacterium]|nr:methylated-DNA--[protein]-cysteine S-methyltransferase [Magnetococcales bacterium]MBF0439360.1 methylated-DNA--[protein]-cysteine S-methyltransferase [Magnetococcales bacterium]
MCDYVTPFGSLWLHMAHGGIIALSSTPPSVASDDHWRTRVGAWLTAYFQGEFLPVEDFPFAPDGTLFQRRVWSALQEIPPGEVETYGHLARRLQTSPRAVGQAVARNPIPILIPCHRVVAARTLGGYSAFGGLDAKRFLLALEGFSSENY